MPPTPQQLKTALTKSVKGFLEEYPTYLSLPQDGTTFCYSDLNGTAVNSRDTQKVSGDAQATSDKGLEYLKSELTNVRLLVRPHPSALFCDLRWTGESDIFQDLCLVELRVTKKGSSSFGVHYLPYMENGITFMKLETSFPLKHFSTAQLSGCTIYVSGDPKAPTIYHANALDVHNDVGDAQERDRRKLDYMNDLYAMVNDNDRYGALIHQLAPADYDHFVEEKREEKFSRNIFGKSKRTMDRGYWQLQRTTVMGEKKSDGTWDFYCQVNVDAKYVRHTLASKFRRRGSLFQGMKCYCYDLPALSILL